MPPSSRARSLEASDEFGISPRILVLAWFSSHIGLVGVLIAVDMYASLDSESTASTVLTSCVACLSAALFVIGGVGSAIADVRARGWLQGLRGSGGRVQWLTGAVARRAAKAARLPRWVSALTWVTTLILLLGIAATPILLTRA
jgi:hypothetical protein